MTKATTTTRYPGIDAIPTQMVIRTLGSAGSRERLCCGFMHKDGVRDDELDCNFETYALVYIVRGQGTYITPDNQRVPLGPGSIFQRLPGVRHSTLLDPESRWAECFIDVGPKLYAALQDMRIIRNDVYVYHITPDPLLEERLYELMISLAQCAESELSGMLVQLLSLHAEIIKLCERSEGDDEVSHMVNTACAFLRSRCKERIDIRQLCESHAWGYELFRKLFKERVGLAPMQYLLRHRMDLACQLLKSSRKPVGEIAVYLGYKNQYEFATQFKRHIGLSPTAYRDRG